MNNPLVSKAFVISEPWEMPAKVLISAGRALSSIHLSCAATVEVGEVGGEAGTHPGPRYVYMYKRYLVADSL